MGENSKGLLKEITEFGNPSVEDFVSAIHRVTHGDRFSFSVIICQQTAYVAIFRSYCAEKTKQSTEN
jgi:hypothetical protein